MKLTNTTVAAVRSKFPALTKTVDGKQAVFFDGPAGTQVPQRVIDAISHYLSHCNANHDGVFASSIESDRVLHDAHQAAADLVGCQDSAEIAFGANMTSLTFALSRALARTWNQLADLFGDLLVGSRRKPRCGNCVVQRPFCDGIKICHHAEDPFPILCQPGNNPMPVVMLHIIALPFTRQRFDIHTWLDHPKQMLQELHGLSP